jgi:hypothetical protein
MVGSRGRSIGGETRVGEKVPRVVAVGVETQGFAPAGHGLVDPVVAIEAESLVEQRLDLVRICARHKPLGLSFQLHLVKFVIVDAELDLVLRQRSGSADRDGLFLACLPVSRRNADDSVNLGPGGRVREQLVGLEHPFENQIDVRGVGAQILAEVAIRVVLLRSGRSRPA